MNGATRYTSRFDSFAQPTGSDRFLGKISGTILLIVGAMGAGVQSVVLWNDLVGSYPFKMMSMPPAEFYESIGYEATAYAWLLSTAFGFCLLYLTRLPQYIAGIVPLLLTPLTYIAHVHMRATIGPFRDALHLPENFDGIRANDAHAEFTRGTIDIWVVGIEVYVATALIVGLVWFLPIRDKSSST